MTSKQKQIYGALCLQNFCNHYNIEYGGIDKLLIHLLSINKRDDLIQWDTEGKQLEITGRGDKLPTALIKKIGSETLIQDLSELIDSVVEIGIVDMYGADSIHPSNFIRKCIKILENHDVPLPSIEDVIISTAP